MGYDFIEYLVGEAKMAAFWHVQAMGFDAVAYRGPETGVAQKVSYLLTKNDLKIVITSSIGDQQVKNFVDIHGSGIRTLGVRVDNIAACKQHLVEQDAILLGMYEESDAKGSVSKIDVKLFDDNVITFSDYSNYQGDYLPGFERLDAPWGRAKFDNHLIAIDHIAFALRKNEIKIWEDYLNRMLNSLTIFEFHSDGGQLDIHMKVLGNSGKSMSNVIVEPVRLNGKSQVNVFIDHNSGNGIQHIAFRSENIFETIDSLRSQGMEFIYYPDEYYQALKERHPDMDVDRLRQSGVLCEQNDQTRLYQTFTQSISDKPTCFYEIIERHKEYIGFGMENITALFEAVEKNNQE